MQLYSGPLSLFARKVEIALREKALPFERVMVPFSQEQGYAPKHPAVLAANPKGQVPAALEQLAQKIKAADGFIFITGEYNWGVQPGLKNLTDHFLEEWFWRPAAIVSYSAGRLGGARAATAWHGTLSEMGMVVTSSTIAVGQIGQTFSGDGQPTGDGGKALEQSFPRFADDLAWWTEAARAQRERRTPPY